MTVTKTLLIKPGLSFHGNLGKFYQKFDPGPFIYVWPVGGLENHLC